MVCKGHSCTHGIAITAEHTALIFDLDRLFPFFSLCRRDGRRGAGGYDQWDLTNLIKYLMVYNGGFPVVAQEGDIRTMHCTAHIQAAGHGNPDLGRKGHALEVLEEIIQDRFDH